MAKHKKLSAIGERLEWLRVQHNLGQAQFSKLLGAHQSAYSRVCRGERELPLTWAIAAAARFKLTLDFIYFGSTIGLDRDWVERLLASPSGLELLSRRNMDLGTDMHNP